MSKDTAFAKLNTIFAKKPSSRRWSAVKTVIRTYPGENLEPVLRYAQAGVAAWPWNLATHTSALDTYLVQPPAFWPLISLLKISGSTVLDKKTLQPLLVSGYVRHLRGLGFETHLVTSGFRALARSPVFAQLETLSVDDCEIGDEGMAAITERPGNLKQLFVLQDKRGIGPTTITNLAQSRHLAGLQELNLSYNNEHGSIGAAEIEVLARSPYLQQLRCLRLCECDVGDAGTRALAASGNLRQLQKLSLDSNNIGPKGAVALAKSPHLAQLTELSLDHNRLTKTGIQALLRSPHLQSLNILSIRDVKLNKTSETALLKEAAENKIKLKL